MAIIDYDSLVASVRSYAARSDSSFNSQMPTFVGLAEERLYNGFGERGEPLFSAPIRSSTLEAAGTITVTDGVGALPADYLSMRKLYRPGDTIGLKYMPPERAEVEEALEASGTPIYYTIEVRNLKLIPSWDGDLTVLYYKRHPDITVTNTTGPMITAHGLAYLEATLIEAFSWMQDGDLAVAHAAKLRGLVSGINKGSNELRFSGPLRVRPRQFIP